MKQAQTNIAEGPKCVLAGHNTFLLMTYALPA